MVDEFARILRDRVIGKLRDSGHEVERTYVGSGPCDTRDRKAYAAFVDALTAARPRNASRDPAHIGMMQREVMMIKTTESMTADEFREIRKELGLTQDELAEVLGYHGGNHVSRIERGKTPVNKRSAIIMKRLRDHNRPR